MLENKIRININDIIGKHVGRLKVTDYAGHAYDHTAGGDKLRHYYLCKCSCGKIKIIQRGPLLNDIVHSCGCLRRK